MRKHINSALKILTKVFSEGTYSNMAFYGEDVSDMTTKLVYGVLENNIQLEYVLGSLVPKKPQNVVYVLLKIGTYALMNLTDVPKFAIVSECVEVAKMNGKGGASGFVNAVLKKVADGKYALVNENEENYLSIKYSKPQWFIDKTIERYGRESVIAMLQEPYDALEHIRVNSRLATCEDVEKCLEKHKEKYQKTDVGGYKVRATECIKRMFDKGLVTYQSPSSMLAVQALGARDGAQILDICSAPGGKAVYLSELCPHSTVIACDLHPHRVALIQKYKNRMHVPNVKALQADATKLNSDWIGKFDFVLADAPCSCLGTYRKHPDVFLTRKESDISEMAHIQNSIAQNALAYLKTGGVMIYSTCTLFKEENDDVVDALVKSGKAVLEHIDCDNIDGGKYAGNVGKIQILPHAEYDGFYIAKLRKI